MLRLSDLAYLGRQREEYPISGLLDESLYGQPPAPSNYPMLLAQAPTSGGIAGGVHHEINTNPELYGPRPTAPAAPQGGGYKTGSDYVHKPLTQDQVDAWRAKVRAEEAQRRAATRR